MTTFYFPDEPYNLNRHLIFTTALVVSSLALGVITCDLGAVFELIGATSACALAYILPPLCYVKLSKQSWKQKIPAYICITFGVTVMCISVLQAVAKMIRSKFLVGFPPCPFLSLRCSLTDAPRTTDDGGVKTC
jgi:sodium-coupled neutral amino acid transporter 11